MAYDYIARVYGKRFEAVMRVRGDPQYVSVKFDNGRVGDCHPMSLNILPPTPTLDGGE